MRTNDVTNKIHNTRNLRKTFSSLEIYPKIRCFPLLRFLISQYFANIPKLCILAFLFIFLFLTSWDFQFVLTAQRPEWNWNFKQCLTQFYKFSLRRRCERIFLTSRIRDCDRLSSLLQSTLSTSFRTLNIAYAWERSCERARNPAKSTQTELLICMRICLIKSRKNNARTSFKQFIWFSIYAWIFSFKKNLELLIEFSILSLEISVWFVN